MDIINESPEISLGEQENWLSKLSSAFPAFRYRNYRLYFTGQLVSLVGTWLQIVAEGILVYALTHSAFLVGLVAALGTLPVLLFSLYAGVIVDRFPKQKILLITQTFSLGLAAIYGTLAVFRLINVFEIGVLAFLLGMVNVFDFPARQAFNVELVERKDLASAIALNAGMFNGARVIGPAVAGILIGLVGSGGTFLLNAASYIPANIAIWKMRVHEEKQDVHPNQLQAIKDGLTYSFSHSGLALLLIISCILSIFGWSYATIFPVYVPVVFHGGDFMVGFLSVFSGCGALLASVMLSVFSKKIPPVVFIIGGNLLFALSIIGFSFARTFPVAVPFLFLSGFGLLSQFATMNTTIQHAVPDQLRGRVMSIYTIMFLGMAPVGSLQIGFLAEHFGPQMAIRIGAIIVLLSGIALFFYRDKLETLGKHVV